MSERNCNIILRNVMPKTGLVQLGRNKVRSSAVLAIVSCPSSDRLTLTSYDDHGDSKLKAEQGSVLRHG